MGRCTLPSLPPLNEDEASNHATIDEPLPTPTKHMTKAKSVMGDGWAPKTSPPEPVVDPPSVYGRRRANTSYDQAQTVDKQIQVRLVRMSARSFPSLRRTNHRPTTTQIPELEPPSYAESQFHGPDTQHPSQDRYPSFLVRPLQRIGDAQASPPVRQNTKEYSPIDTAVGRIQEAGRSARAKALQTAGEILDCISQGMVDKQEARDRAFLNCVHMFERYPFDNYNEVAQAFQVVSILVQEELMERYDLVRIAQLLHERGSHDGYQILLRLINSDRRVMLTDDERAGLAIVAWGLGPGCKRKDSIVTSLGPLAPSALVT